jgi:hypothetical protein
MEQTRKGVEDALPTCSSVLRERLATPSPRGVMASLTVPILVMKLIVDSVLATRLSVIPLGH